MTTRTKQQRLPEMTQGTRAPPLKILFLNGSKSVPASTHPAFLAQHGHEVVNPARSEEDFEEDVRIARRRSTVISRTSSWAGVAGRRWR